MRFDSLPGSSSPEGVVGKRPIMLSMGFCLLLALPASAQYQQTNIVSNGFVPAEIINPNLINPWGVSSAVGGPFWISNQDSNFQNLSTGNSSAVSTLLSVPATGAAPSQPGLIVNVPNQGNAAGNLDTNGPTGQVSPQAAGITTNPTDFQVVGPNGGTSHEANFIFANQDGSLSAWAGANSGTPIANTTATLLPTTVVAGASFTGLAIANNPSAATGVASGAQLYAADQNSTSIDVFNAAFQKIGSFNDPNVPAGYTAFNVQNINGILYVTYANQNNPLGGIVDEFAPDGTFIKRLIDDSNTSVPEHLQLPWGVTLAPSTFGQFAGDLLVGNDGGDGGINAFNPTTGAWVGELTLANGQIFSEGNLWALTFGTGGNNGNPNTLYFTAGGPNETDGLFGSLAPLSVPEPASVVLIGIGVALVAVVQFRRRKSRPILAASAL
jgi:uncharacterized protein (TIGR03118 family)